MNQLTLENLACERDQRVLFSQLSAEFSSGDVVQIIGPNGSGKTTLLRVLSTLSGVYDGEFYWNGQSVRQHPLDYRQQLLYLSHATGIKKQLTPRENLHWYQCASQFSSRVTLVEALAAVGLMGYEDVMCDSLSAGQLRRVALARLYLTPSPLWLLDEPFTAIDKEGVLHLEHLIRHHAQQGGIVLLTTHQPFEQLEVKPLNLLDYAVVEPDYA